MKPFATIAFIFALGLTSLASTVRDAQKEIGLDAGLWKVLHEEEGTISWLAEPGVVVTFMVHPGHGKDLPPQNKKSELRSYYRDEALSYKGGLVEVDTRIKTGVGFNLVTMKFPMSQGIKGSLGWGYQINAVFPTKSRTYVIQIAALEQGTTGVREAAVTVILSAKDGSKDLSSVMKRFRRDPYDQKFDDKAVFTISDERQWDEGFPDHPLTKVRAYIEKIVEGLALSSTIRDTANYKNGTSS